jgi:CRISPR-associated protein Cas1
LLEAARRLRQRLADAHAEIGVDALRGYEGDAARIYFAAFDDLIVSQKDGFAFHGRSRRPPQDNVNALLSFVYSLLEHDARSALAAVGLDPAVGFLHADRPGRPGLSLDVMEELRAFVADRLVLSLINLRVVQPEGFDRGPTGGVTMNDATRKSVLVAYQQRKHDEIMHPYLGERVTVGLILHLQALLLARYLRGDLDAYPAFIWK